MEFHNTKGGNADTSHKQHTRYMNFSWLENITNICKQSCFSYDMAHMSRPMGKSTICIGENKDADQLRGNREDDQRLCLNESLLG